MAPDIESLKNVAPILTPFITALIDTWIKPKLAQLIRSRGTNRLLLEHAVTNRFEEYLANTCERYSYISVLAFQNHAGTMIELLNQKRHDVIRKWSSARISSGEARSKNLLINKPTMIGKDFVIGQYCGKLLEEMVSILSKQDGAYLRPAACRFVKGAIEKEIKSEQKSDLLFGDF